MPGLGATWRELERGAAQAKKCVTAPAGELGRPEASKEHTWRRLDLTTPRLGRRLARQAGAGRPVGRTGELRTQLVAIWQESGSADSW